MGKSVAIGAVNYSLQITSNMINNGMTFSQAAAASSFTIGYSFTPQWGMGRQQNINAGMLSNGSAYADAVVAHGNYQKEKDSYLRSYATSGDGIAPAFNSFQDWYGKTFTKFDNYSKNVNTAASMTLSWAFGVGSEKRTFFNDRVANSFKDAYRVNEARNFYYQKYNGIKNLANTSVIGYRGSFGLSGAWNAGLDPIEQFVGTYRINIYNFSGNKLWFILTNQTSMNSFLYDSGPSWQRSTWSPGGNINQTYIWSEPVRK